MQMHGVTDPNHQLIAVGWEEGTLRCRWRKGEGEHTVEYQRTCFSSSGVFHSLIANTKPQFRGSSLTQRLKTHRRKYMDNDNSQNPADWSVNKLLSKAGEIRRNQMEQPITYKTLRDEIAIAALTGILQRDEAIISKAELAKWCYAVADETLAAREAE